jgi:hypothetical protein
LCARCRRETSGDAAALVGMVSEARQLRLELDPSEPARVAASVGAFERVFEETGDVIPY